MSDDADGVEDDEPEIDRAFTTRPEILPRNRAAADIDDFLADLGLAPEPVVAPARETYRRNTLSLAMEAATQQARLDERLYRASPAIRAGWGDRWAIMVTAASARLDYGDAVDPREIVLDELDASTEAASLENARRILPMILLAQRRRSEADILTPKRLAAAVVAFR